MNSATHTHGIFSSLPVFFAPDAVGKDFRAPPKCSSAAHPPASVRAGDRPGSAKGPAAHSIAYDDCFLKIDGTRLYA